jgi:hypothetical protein
LLALSEQIEPYHPIDPPASPINALQANDAAWLINSDQLVFVLDNQVRNQFGHKWQVAYNECVFTPRLKVNICSPG